MYHVWEEFKSWRAIKNCISRGVQSWTFGTLIIEIVKITVGYFEFEHGHLLKTAIFGYIHPTYPYYNPIYYIVMNFDLKNGL